MRRCRHRSRDRCPRFPWGERDPQGRNRPHPDVEVELAEFPACWKSARLRGYRSMLFVPLLREGTADRRHQRHARGARPVRRPSRPAAADLRRSGRDCHWNVRLFDEVQARARDAAHAILRSSPPRLHRFEMRATSVPNGSFMKRIEASPTAGGAAARFCRSERGATHQGVHRLEHTFSTDGMALAAAVLVLTERAIAEGQSANKLNCHRR